MTAPISADTETRLAISEGLSKLVSGGTVHELRVPVRPGRVISGYFRDTATLAVEAAKLSGKHPGIYFTLNPVRPDHLARRTNRVEDYPKATTSDSDIERRRWLPIDFDPIRPADISSTEAQHEAAIQKAREAFSLLKRLGAKGMVAMDSGNGAYVLVPIDLANDGETRALVNRCLATLAFRLDDEVVHVDQAMGNAARILRVPGTLNCNGDNLPDHPHRPARILKVDGKSITERSVLEKLAALAPELPTNGSQTPPPNGFDLDAFVRRHLDVSRSAAWGGGWRWILRTSPLCDHEPDHGEVYVVRQASGVIAAGCQRAHCAWRWADLREHFEPGYRERRQEANGRAAVDDSVPPTSGPARNYDHVILVPDGVG